MIFNGHGPWLCEVFSKINDYENKNSHTFLFPRLVCLLSHIPTSTRCLTKKQNPDHCASQSKKKSVLLATPPGSIPCCYQMGGLRLGNSFLEIKKKYVFVVQTVRYSVTGDGGFVADVTYSRSPSSFYL